MVEKRGGERVDGFNFSFGKDLLEATDDEEKENSILS